MDKSIKILVLNWRDWKHPLAGGAEQSLQKHVEYWVKNGAQVTWISSMAEGLKKDEMINHIRVIRMGSHYTTAFSFFIYFKKNKFDDFDIIIDCFHFFPYFTKLYMKKKIIIAMINEVAGSVWFDNLIYPLSLVGYLIEPYVIRTYNNLPFITGSNSAAQDLVKVGIDKKSITVINHGFNQPKKEYLAKKKEKKPTLIFIGRVSRDKGIEDALKMLAMAVNDNLDIQLWVIGKYESIRYGKKINDIVRQYKIEKNCRFFGFVSEKKKFELLSRSMLIIHPSSKEGWGLNIIEANSCRVPAVGYNVEGLRDSIVDNNTGLLVDKNPRALYEGVKKLLASKKLYDMMSSNAYKWSSNFSWEKAGAKSWEVIRNELKNGNIYTK